MPLTPAQARHLLGPEATHLTDAEIQQILTSLYQLAHELLEQQEKGEL